MKIQLKKLKWLDLCILVSAMEKFLQGKVCGKHILIQNVDN